MVTGGAELAAIAAATSKAAEKSMIEASGDLAVRHSFFLLTQIPEAARQEDFVAALRGLGLSVGDHPTLTEISTATMEAIDVFVAAAGARTDYGELAQLSAVESLQAVIGRDALDLVDGEARLKTSVAAYGNSRRFAELSREFFSRLTRRHLNFYLHRELSAHVGADKRFPSLRELAEFDRALDLHCREASRIIQEFSNEWYGKHLAEGGIDGKLAGGFVHVASKKIREELRRRGDTNV